MKKKKIILSIAAVLALLVVLSMCLGRYEHPDNEITSGKINTIIPPSHDSGHAILPDQPVETQAHSTERAASSSLPKTHLRRPLPDSKGSPLPSLEAIPGQPVKVGSAMPLFSVSLEALPTQPGQAESAMKRSTSKAPARVLRPEKMPMVDPCRGEPISECIDVYFTHCDFALLIVEILAPGAKKSCEEAFESLESLHISPRGGWARANPQKRITSGETEEVRCSISLAFEDGAIAVGPSIVITAMNSFCEGFQVSLKTIEDSGIHRDRSDFSADRGYQGGTDGVASTPF